MSLFSDIKAGINSLLNEGDVDYDEDNFEKVALNAMKDGTSAQDAAALLSSWRASNKSAKEMDYKQENGIGFFQKDVIITAKNFIDKFFKKMKLKSGKIFNDIKFSYPSNDTKSEIGNEEISIRNDNDRERVLGDMPKRKDGRNREDDL